MTKLHHILKVSWFDVFPTEHFAVTRQVYLWFLEFLKVEWALSVIRPFSCGTSCQYELPVCVWEAETFSTFKIRLKTFVFDNAYSWEWLTLTHIP